MSDEIKLTLNPVMDTAAAVEEAPEAQAEAEVVAKQVQEDAQKTQQFTPEEQKMVDEFARQIDVTDSNIVFSYGAAAQQNISQFSDSVLKNVKTKDLDTIGDQIAQLVTELRGFYTDEEEPKSIFSFSKNNVTILQI